MRFSNVDTYLDRYPAQNPAHQFKYFTQPQPQTPQMHDAFGSLDARKRGGVLENVGLVCIGN